MGPHDTALLLIGFQNDYFASDGALRGALEDAAQARSALDRTVHLVEKLASTPVPIVSAPIIFTTDYGELVHRVGILKAIAEARAFQDGTPGAAVVPELARFGDRILQVPGRRGLNAFSNTDLDRVLRERNVSHVVLAGVITSICIDSTARSAHERGYRVTVISDCTAGRSRFEQEFYCGSIFPLYAEVSTSGELLSALKDPAAA